MARRYMVLVVLGGGVLFVSIAWLSYSVTRPNQTANLASPEQPVARVKQNAAQKPKVLTASTEPGKDVSGLKPKDLEAMAYVYADERLKTWLENWAAHAPETIPDESELQTLKNILDQSPLSAGALMTVGHGFNKQAGAPVVVREIYHAAALKMDGEISKGLADSGASSEAALAFTKNRQNIKDVLWPLIEGSDDRTALDTMYLFYSDFLKYNSPTPKDSRMKAVAQSARIGLAGCCYLKGQFTAAMSLIEESRNDDLSGDRKTSLEWIWGLVLFSQGRYSEAVPHIQILAEDATFDGSHRARELLIRALCASGDTEGASRWIENFSRQHPEDKALQGQFQSIFDSYQHHTERRIASDDALEKIKG